MILLRIGVFIRVFVSKTIEYHINLIEFCYFYTLITVGKLKIMELSEIV